ncbi:MAG TPA: hypothetical protein VGC89_14625 [Pyrinomonadaceae bacterium]
MIPAVPLPQNSKIRTPVDVKLKPEWRYDASGRRFVSETGERFKPGDELPKGSRIVYKVPAVAQEADRSKLSEAERELQLYMQVILPAGESPADYVAAIRRWPPIAEARLPPEISLPMQLS